MARGWRGCWDQRRQDPDWSTTCKGGAYWPTSQEVLVVSHLLPAGPPLSARRALFPGRVWYQDAGGNSRVLLDSPQHSLQSHPSISLVTTG